jgi:hypothetical protein
MSYSVLYIFVTVIWRQQYFAHISVSIQSSILEGCTSILRVKGRSLLPKGDHYYQREIIITKGRVNNGAEGGAGTLAHMSRKARTGHKGEEGRGTSGTE